MMLDGFRRRLSRRRAGGLEELLSAFGRAHPSAFFIQVGSNDGLQLDPLRPHILNQEWNGVLIEPLPYVFERLRRNYGHVGRVRLENVALADHDGSQTLYYLPEAPNDRSLPPWYDTLASFRKDVVLRHKTEIPDIEQRLASVDVPCLTFESLCRKLQIDRVDLIHIDAEGYDFEIIKSIDLARYGPKILLFEHFHMDRGTFAECLSHLGTHGYEYVHVGMDTVCLRPATLTRVDRRVRRVWDRLRARPEEPLFR